MATVLARSGISVILADRDGGAEDGLANGSAEGCADSHDDYDVLISGPALHGLESAAIDIGGLPAARTDIIDLRFDGGPAREISGTGATVCGMRRLRHILRGAAAAAGAEIIAGTVTSVERDSDGYRALIDGASGQIPIMVQHAAVTTGSGRGALTPAGPSHTTGLSCAQRFTGPAADPRIVLALAAPSAAKANAEPACVWALPPGSDGTITVGTAMVGGRARHPADLLGRARAVLARADPRFAGIQPAGPPVSGPLDTGFAPARLKQACFLLAGDAAGLVNPFTGEGLSYAVQSALLAARLIAANPDDPDAAHRIYTRRLSVTFVGYFETARHAARRYHLAWRILAAGADSDHPFFAKGRRAILLPEGFSGLTAPERMDLASPDTVLLAPFLAACDEVAITVVRNEWPFLARLALSGESLGHHRLRPAVPFFAALLAAGNKPDIRHATVAAAIELALLGALAVLGPAPRPGGARGIDWALTATILAGDFLLAQASKLVAQSAPGISWAFADWLAEVTALRAARLVRPSRAPAGAVFASLFEFPARIGAELGGSSPEIVEALRDFGQHCGLAFANAEDVLALRGERTRLDTTLAVMLEGKFSGIPDSLDGEELTRETIAADPLLQSRALAAATGACLDARRRALDSAASVPDPVAVRILRQFATAVAAPCYAQVPSSTVVRQLPKRFVTTTDQADTLGLVQQHAPLGAGDNPAVRCRRP